MYPNPRELAFLDSAANDERLAFRKVLNLTTADTKDRNAGLAVLQAFSDFLKASSADVQPEHCKNWASLTTWVNKASEAVQAADPSKINSAAEVVLAKIEAQVAADNGPAKIKNALGNDISFTVRGVAAQMMAPLDEFIGLQQFPRLWGKCFNPCHVVGVIANTCRLKALVGSTKNDPRDARATFYSAVPADGCEDDFWTDVSDRGAEIAGILSKLYNTATGASPGSSPGKVGSAVDMAAAIASGQAAIVGQMQEQAKAAAK